MITDENDLGKGGIEVEQDPTIAQASDVLKDVAPFDWNLGCDIELKVGKIKVKNQQSSGSCGGQAASYLEGVLEAKRDNKPYEEKSARYVYAPVAVPGGGSSEPALINRILTAGDADEVLVPSNRPDGSTDEEFMINMDDIDPIDIINGLENKGLRPLYYNNQNIDDLACAIRDNGGVIIGINGQNNGTWLTEFPKPPQQTEWRHWLYFGRAKMINGKKYLGTPNSWGTAANGGNWQWIGEDYLSNTFRLWGVVLDTPLNSLSLKKDLKRGMKDIDVAKLQSKLKGLGFFPKEQEITTYFGNITLQSLIAFQKANNITPAVGYCGIITRTALNKLKIAGEPALKIMTNFTFRWDKFLTIAVSSFLLFISTNLGNISWTKAGLMSAGIAAVQFVIQAIIKYASTEQ